MHTIFDSDNCLVDNIVSRIVGLYRSQHPQFLRIPFWFFQELSFPQHLKSFIGCILQSSDSTVSIRYFTGEETPKVTPKVTVERG